jgi:hypothetical protein
MMKQRERARAREWARRVSKLIKARGVMVKCKLGMGAGRILKRHRLGQAILTNAKIDVHSPEHLLRPQRTYHLTPNLEGEQEPSSSHMSLLSGLCGGSTWPGSTCLISNQHLRL